MKIFLIHGDHTLNSYNRLQDYVKRLKDQNIEIQRIENETKEIREKLLGQSLFSNSRFIIIKDINIINSNLIKWINKNDKRINANIIIYHRGIIPQKLIKSLGRIEKNEEFKIPKLIWSFLDSFFPSNIKNAYKLFHEVLKNEPIEFIFAMLVKQTRDIYWTKVDPKTMDYPSWRVGKLKNLASKFDLEKLEKLIEEIAITDIKVKTSQADLTQSLDFLIAKYLE